MLRTNLLNEIPKFPEPVASPDYPNERAGLLLDWGSQVFGLLLSKKHPIQRGTMKLKYKDGTSHYIASFVREGRPCGHEGAAEIMQQIGKMNILAVSGGRVGLLEDAEGDKVGIFLPVTHDRRVEVILTVMDTYRVIRSRHILKGENAGTEVIEAESEDVYCDEVGEAVYQASCWK